MRVLPLLEKEYSFWMQERSAEISIPGSGNVTLNLYRAEHWNPRPESFVEDKATAGSPKFDTELKKQILYQNIASAAESGWDFSGRWINGNNLEKGLEAIQTIMTVPTDLNVFMLKNEMIFIELFKIIGGDASKIEFYEKQAAKRKQAMNVVFSDLTESKSLKWTDFDLGTMNSANRSVYISDLAQVWLLSSESKNLSDLLKENQDILFKYPGGIPASEVTTGQQWDFPNVWAPVQQLFIESYLKIDDGKYGEYYGHALNTSQRFINSVYCGYEMFGKLT